MNRGNALQFRQVLVRQPSAALGQPYLFTQQAADVKTAPLAVFFDTF
jgi:hypothetical protein